MALTLDAALDTAQDSKARRPLIELLSGQRVADIPFDGTFLTGSSDEETAPTCLELADGRIAVCYHYYISVSDRGLKFYITNTARNFFETNFTINTGTALSGATIEQLDNGNIGIVYLELISTTYYQKYKIITTAGANVSAGTIATYSDDYFFSHMWVRQTASNFLLVYIHDLISYVSPSSGGAYTGSAIAEFTMEVTTSGTETTGYFQWKKNDGSWTGPIIMTGGAQALSDGVTITFNAGNYYDGQFFKFTSSPAVKAVGSITISSLPDDGDQVILGATTYTFKDALVAGGSANEVLIDPLSQEITLQNLLCAITDTTFEGTGEGVRYGNGTTANASATGTRSTIKITLEALTAGAAGNSITLTVDTDHFSKVAFAGGADASNTAVTGGGLYALYKRTSTDFVTWGSETQISLGSLLPARLKDSPSLTRLSNDDIMLFFDYADEENDNLDSLSNIYFMTSSDDGASWDTPDSITESVSFAEVSRHPVAVERDTGALYAMYTRIISALRMDKSAAGWPNGSSDDWAYELSWDSVNRKLYVTNMFTAAGLKRIQCVVKIDVDTWSVDNYWDRDSTTPRFSITSGSTEGRFIGDGYYVPVYDGSGLVVDLLNGDTGNITNYYFVSDVQNGYVKNVTNYTQYESADKFRTAQVDSANNRLWIYMLDYTGLSVAFHFGYLDMTEGGPEYTYTSIVAEVNTAPIAWIVNTEMRVYPDDDLIFISGFAQGGFVGTKGGLKIYDLEGTQTDDFSYDVDSGFPIWGLKNLCYYDGYLYGDFGYESGFSQDNRRGIAKINLATRTITYHRPTWASVDDYGITSIERGAAGKLIITCYNYGVTIYDIASDSWTLYNNTTIPDMIPDADYSFRCSAYDSTNNYVFAGYHDQLKQYRGIVMFSTVGQIIQSYYQVGTYPVDTWVWQTESNIVQGFGDKDIVGAIDSDDTMFCFWQSDDRSPTADAAIKWDQDGSGVNLSQYLMSDQEVTVRKAIDGSPNTLEFTCSDGHLFDPFNSLSLLSQTFKKGRKITLRWGETISGAPVWQNGGEFYVISATTSYRRGSYSSMQVKCEDDRTFWVNKKLLVSASYNDTPQNILDNMLQNYAGISAGDIDLPEMATSNLQYQFVDVSLEDAINKVCNRFGYFFTINVDGEYTARKIDDGNATDHTYSDLDAVLEFDPDNTYSNFINQVRVIGQELTVSQVSTEEEIVGNLDGSVGWHTGKKEHEVWFSEDRERTAQSVRLKVIETATSIGFALRDGITEELTYTDPAGKYCIVTIDSPDLTPELIAALAALVASWFIPDVAVLGQTIRVGSYLSAFACWAASNILGAVGTFQYEIWGFPIGEVSRSLEAVANDTVNQTETGYIVGQDINDDMCYSTADCQFVADFELMVIMLQRNNLKVNKVTHLQDEEGDTIIFPHPYSGENMKMFATELTRRFKKATKDGEEGDGYFYDDIDGWVIL
jgi:hypothetical protein